MKKVELREDEQKKYTTIKKLVETGGNKKKAATKLNCSLRTIDRMIVRYKNQGKAGFIHGNRGKMPSTTISQETKNKIVDLYINEYLNTNYTYFCQIIKDKFKEAEVIAQDDELAVVVDAPSECAINDSIKFIEDNNYCEDASKILKLS